MSDFGEDPFIPAEANSQAASTTGSFAVPASPMLASPAPESVPTMSSTLHPQPPAVEFNIAVDIEDARMYDTVVEVLRGRSYKLMYQLEALREASKAAFGTSQQHHLDAQEAGANAPRIQESAELDLANSLRFSRLANSVFQRIQSLLDQALEQERYALHIRAQFPGPPSFESREPTDGEAVEKLTAFQVAVANETNAANAGKAAREAAAEDEAEKESMPPNSPTNSSVSLNSEEAAEERQYGEVRYVVIIGGIESGVFQMPMSTACAAIFHRRGAVMATFPTSVQACAFFHAFTATGPGGGATNGEDAGPSSVTN